MNDEQFKSAFAEYDRNVRIANSKLGAVLAILLMPAGIVLDLFVYPEKVGAFLQLRLLCSLMVGIVLGLFFTSFGKRHYRVLGMTWYMLPALFIAWMIFVAQDPLSPYYAGLNIVLLGVGLILPWTYQENLLAGGLVISMYLGACFLQGTIHEVKYLVNNLYFLVLTALIVVTGSYFHSKLRFREFSLRFELDENRKKLEEGNRKLVELDRVKSQFFANMSHELRTPLTLLLAPLETILYSKTHALDADTRGLLQTMQANGMRLLKLINDLLDVEKLESGRMEIRRDAVDIPGFLRGLASSVQGVARDKRIQLKTAISDGVGVISVDRDKLEKIILNLLFNALKFTPAGGDVSLVAERRDSKLIVQVKDTGTGIAENHLPFIFDRFWQADTSSQRRYQGTGIGLALVKELVQAQDGSVTAESQVNKGTTMTIELPYVETMEQPMIEQQVEAPKVDGTAIPVAGNGHKTADEWLTQLYRRAELFPAMTPLQETLRPEEITSSGRPRLLVADDEPDMLRFLKSQLVAQFDVIEAVDGLQAVEKASQFFPEMILLDMMMPEKDGLQVCRELRARTSTRSIPIILLTARADEETKLAALSAGANDFLSKPFSTTELHVRVKNLVEQHSLQRKLARQNQILEATLEQLKDAQAQLVHSEKMASLGRMSAGIIHEINNPLNYAKTGLYSLRKKQKHLPEGERPVFDDIIRDIEEGVDRVKNIVSDLRTFTHPNAGQLESIDATKLVSAGLRFLSDQLKDIRIEQAIPAGFSVYGNYNKLIQVIVNVVQNSLDALKKKRFADGECATISIRAQKQAGRNVIVIRDNGEGISQEHLDKVYDPFFTTKDVGEGMGLGLSISYRIMTEAGGRITVKSEAGHFTEFTLEFGTESNNIRANDLG